MCGECGGEKGGGEKGGIEVLVGGCSSFMSNDKLNVTSGLVDQSKSPLDAADAHHQHHNGHKHGHAGEDCHRLPVVHDHFRVATFNDVIVFRCSQNTLEARQHFV